MAAGAVALFLVCGGFIESLQSHTELRVTEAHMQFRDVVVHTVRKIAVEDHEYSQAPKLDIEIYLQHC